MKHLFTFAFISCFCVTAFGQPLTTLLSATFEGDTPSLDSPVESYWMTKSMDPLNYNTVLESIAYDARAVQAGLEGMVLVRVLVDEHGHYYDHEIIHGAHSILIEAVEKKIHHLQFPHPELQGKSVSALVTVPFRFRLTDGW